MLENKPTAEIKNKARNINRTLKSITQNRLKNYKTQYLCPNKGKIEQSELRSYLLLSLYMTMSCAKPT